MTDDILTSPLFCYRFSLSLLRQGQQVSCIYVVAAARPMPPVQERTRGVKVPCSTSLIRWSYAPFLIFSCVL